MQNQNKLTLESIEVRAVSIPMRRPIVSKVGIYPEWPFILIDVKTKEGIVGRSYLEPYLKDAVRYIGPAILDLADMLKGRQLAPLDFYRDAMKQTASDRAAGRKPHRYRRRRHGHMGRSRKGGRAATGRAFGRQRRPASAYNTNGLWLIPLDRLGREAEQLVAEGNFNAIKIRLGRPTLRQDLEALKAVRGGNRLRHRSHVRFQPGSRTARGNLSLSRSWMTRVFTGSRSRSSLTTTRIAPNWRVNSGRRFRSARTSMGRAPSCRRSSPQAADLYMPDLMRIGGVTGWMRSAAIAGASGHPMSSHLYPEVSAHLLRATETCDWLEWRDWGNPIIAEPFEVKDGFVNVPNRPGNGIDWNEDAIRKFAY